MNSYIAELNVYPVKSCRGIARQRVMLEAAGFEHDREWMIVRPNGRFVTQRELPRLALIAPAIEGSRLVLRADSGDELNLPLRHSGATLEVVVWRDRCAAIDAGDEAADWLAKRLGEPLRLVRFPSGHRRLSSPEWTGDVAAENRFSDGFPILVIGAGSLADLNSRLQVPLPMNRFRPNLVLANLPPYAEDDAHEFVAGAVRLRRVKPCTRCVITTTDQATGEVDGPEPLRTLMSYRMSKQPPGVAFGQNLVVIAGAGSELAVGMAVQIIGQAHRDGE